MEINRLPTKKQLLTTNFWQMISNCRNEKMGLTDSGEPLHMVVLILKSNLILEPSKKKSRNSAQ
jgi:hypothetical protein